MADLVPPASFVPLCTSKEGATLLWLAHHRPERALPLADSLPELERAIVLLHAADSLVFLPFPRPHDADPASSSREALARARQLYERVDHMAQVQATARWRVVGAAALYGCSLVDIAQRNLWDAVLQLRRALALLSDVSGYSLLVDDMILEGFDSRRARRVIEDMRDKALRRVKIALTLQGG